MRQRLLSSQSTISSAHGTGGGSTRSGEGLKAKPVEKAGGSHVPRIRDDECARALMKRTKASGLFVLCDTHTSELSIRLLDCSSSPQIQRERLAEDCAVDADGSP